MHMRVRRGWPGGLCAPQAGTLSNSARQVPGAVTTPQPRVTSPMARAATATCGERESRARSWCRAWAVTRGAAARASVPWGPRASP